MMPGDQSSPFRVINRTGSSRVVLLCDHASNHVPGHYGDLGLGQAELQDHIAWDPGTLAIGKQLCALLDAPLIQSTISRLVIDCNRMHDAHDLVPQTSEATKIPGNAEVDEVERQNRINSYHTPYHAAITSVLDERLSRGRDSVLVALHSFTPIYHGDPRPWVAGLIHASDESISRVFFDELKRDAPDLEIGWNQPYPSRDGVYFTVDQHMDKRGCKGTIVEIRNDELSHAEGINDWSHRLARCLSKTLSALD